MATLAAAAAGAGVSSGSLDSVPLGGGGGESRAPESPTGTPRLRADETRPGPPQANAVTVLALLDRLLGMLEGVQEAQRRLEERQRATEGVVRSVAGELSRMARSGQSTDGAVAKVLAKARTVSANVKDVRERLERQATQVRKLDAKHGDLLRRNNFRILIFQEGSETPTAEATSRPVGPPQGPAVLVSDEAHGSAHADSSFEEVCIAGEGSDDAGEEAATRPPDLSSDEEYILEEVETTTTRLKKSSMKRMDSLKKAFSKENFEKKMNKFVSPERREKIKKSLTPNHQKSSGSKLGAFKVPPLKFNVKKVRSEGGGGTPNEEEAAAAAEAEAEDVDANVNVTNEDSPAIHGDADSAHGAVQYAEIVFADKTPARQAAALASPAGKAVVAAVAAAAVAAAQAATEARAGGVTLGPADETAVAEKGREQEEEQEEEAAAEKPGGRAEGAAGEDAAAKVVLGQGEEHEEQKTSGKPEEEEEGGEEQQHEQQQQQHEQGEQQQQQQQQAVVFEAAAALSAGEEAPQPEVAPQGPPAVTVSGDGGGGAAANGPLGGHAGADQGPEEAAAAHGKAAAVVAAVAGGVKTELSE